MGARSRGSGPASRSAKVFRKHDTGREVITRSSTQDRVTEGAGISSYVSIEAGSAPEDEVRNAYRELKASFKGDRYRRTMLRIYRKDVRGAMRADRRRSKLRLLRKGKWLSALSVVVALYIGITRDVFPIPHVETMQEFYTQLPDLIADGFHSFMENVPEAPALSVLFAVGILVYLAGAAGVWIKDRGLKRRLLVHAMSESLSEHDSRMFRNAFTKERVWKLMYGKTSVHSIREAAASRTLNDFVRGLTKGPRY